MKNFTLMPAFFLSLAFLISCGSDDEGGSEIKSSQTSEVVAEDKQPDEIDREKKSGRAHVINDAVDAASERNDAREAEQLAEERATFDACKARYVAGNTTSEGVYTGNDEGIRILCGTRP